jgi:hypothetical protein
MGWTVLDAQQHIANEIDQSDDAPSQGGTDWNIRLNALNRALFDWANSNDWDTLKKVHNGLVSTSSANASYVLPSDFSKLDGFPKIVWDGRTTNEFPVIDPSKNSNYLDSDKFVNIFDNSRDGKIMYIHSSTLVSGASVQFTYYKSPQSLASAVDIIEVNDPTFVVQRALYYIYKGREDGRFPEAKVESDRILARMLENEASKGIAYEDRRISNWNEERYSFRIGRD